MSSHGDAKTRDAFRLANDMHLDLIVATAIYPKFAGLDQDLLRVGGSRQCMFVIALALVKWVDFYDHFSGVLPASVRDIAKKLKVETDRPGLRRFRNVVAAHFKDRSGRIPSNAEVEGALREMTGGDLREFLSWINDLDGIKNETVVQTIEKIRDELRDEHHFSDKDLIE